MNIRTTQQDLLKIQKRIRESVKRREGLYREVYFTASLEEQWFDYLKKTEQIKRMLIPLEFMISECDDIIAAMKNDQAGVAETEV